MVGEGAVVVVTVEGTVPVGLEEVDHWNSLFYKSTMGFQVESQLPVLYVCVFDEEVLIVAGDDGFEAEDRAARVQFFNLRESEGMDIGEDLDLVGQ